MFVIPPVILDTEMLASSTSAHFLNSALQTPLLVKTWNMALVRWRSLRQISFWEKEFFTNLRALRRWEYVDGRENLGDSRKGARRGGFDGALAMASFLT
jgi:hypothetical protein